MKGLVGEKQLLLDFNLKGTGTTDMSDSVAVYKFRSPFQAKLHNQSELARIAIIMCLQGKEEG